MIWEQPLPVPEDRWEAMLDELAAKVRQVERAQEVTGPPPTRLARRLELLLRPCPTPYGLVTDRGPRIPTVGIIVAWHRRGERLRVVAWVGLCTGPANDLATPAQPAWPPAPRRRWLWQMVRPERALRLQALLRVRIQTRLQRVGLTLPELRPPLFPVGVRVFPRARAALVRLRSWDPWERPPLLVLIAGAPAVLIPEWTPGKAASLATALGIAEEAAARLLRDELTHAELLGELVAARLGRECP